MKTNARSTSHTHTHAHRAAFIAALMYMFASVSRLDNVRTAASTPRNQGLMLVLVASVVVMAVAADYYHEHHDDLDQAHENEYLRRLEYAIAFGAVSLLVCIILALLFAKKIDNMAVKVLAVFLLGWWAAGAGVATSSKGPFNDTCSRANGYFASWIGFFSAVYFCFHAFNPNGQEEYAALP